MHTYTHTSSIPYPAAVTRTLIHNTQREGHEPELVFELVFYARMYIRTNGITCSPPSPHTKDACQLLHINHRVKVIQFVHIQQIHCTT